jgi:integrase
VRLHGPIIPPPLRQEVIELARQCLCTGGQLAGRCRLSAAILAVFEATGIRLSELAGIRYGAGGPAHGDLDLYRREIRVFGKGGTPRIVTISYEAARSVDRYLRARVKHPLAGRPELWLGVNGRGPLTAPGIYRMVVRRGEQAGVAVHPQRFRHHLSHTWLDRGGAPGDLMELNGWSSPADAHLVRRQRPRRPRPPQLRPHHDRSPARRGTGPDGRPLLGRPRLSPPTHRPVSQHHRRSQLVAVESLLAVVC